MLASLGAAKPLTRFAPSPTGYLHIGHVGHMLYVWGLAELYSGGVLLRIEDHDRQRCKRSFESALLDDLDWLGFQPANTVCSSSPYRQSDCHSAYAGALRHLAATRHVYRCVCTRKTLKRWAALSDTGEATYPGFCREAAHPETASHGLRLGWDTGDPSESFLDGLMGWQVQRPERQCGDLLLRDRLGQWTYQFCVTVDDLRHGIDFVVRGEDLLPSTGRQVRLARLLGRAEPPLYFHHPLAVDEAGVKLSKKQRPPPIRDLRANGVTPAAVLAKAAVAVGLVSNACRLEPVDAAELIQRRHGPTLRESLAADPR